MGHLGESRIGLGYGSDQRIVFFRCHKPNLVPWNLIVPYLPTVSFILDPIFRRVLVIAIVEQQNINFLAKSVCCQSAVLVLFDVQKPVKVVHQNLSYVHPNPSMLVNYMKSNQIREMLHSLLL
jgi:hypothetical protein